MERTENRKSHLIHTDNGEWISDEKAVILSMFEVATLKIAATKDGRELHVQHGPDGTFWCYKHEVEALNNSSKNKFINHGSRK